MTWTCAAVASEGAGVASAPACPARTPYVLSPAYLRTLPPSDASRVTAHHRGAHAPPQPSRPPGPPRRPYRRLCRLVRAHPRAAHPRAARPEHHRLHHRPPAMAAVAYRAMKVFGSWRVLPITLASLVSGLGLALGTSWGPARYRRFHTKFWLTLITVLLRSSCSGQASTASRPRPPRAYRPPTSPSSSRPRSSRSPTSSAPQSPSSSPGDRPNAAADCAQHSSTVGRGPRTGTSE